MKTMNQLEMSQQHVNRFACFFLGPLVVPIKYLTHCALQVQVCHQRLSGAFDFLLIFLCSLIQTLTLTLNPNPTP